MTYRIKVPPKKTALDPAQIMSRSEAVLAVFERHRWWWVLGISLMTAVGVTWGAVLWFQSQQDRKALLLEYEASRILSEALPQDTDPQAKYEKASALYQEILDKYPKSSRAPFAQFQLGNAYLELQEHGKAVEAYQKFMSDFSRQPVLLPMVSLRLGYAHLFQGNTAAALSSFDRVIQDGNAWNRDQAFYEAGRVHEQLGEREAALKKYEGLIKEFPRSPWAGEAQSRLRALGVFDEGAPAPKEDAAPSGGGMEPMAEDMKEK